MDITEIITYLLNYDYSSIDVNKALEIATYVLPMVLGPVLAKTVNKNSKSWKRWSGTFGRAVGLLVSLSDIFRSPKSLVQDVSGKQDVDGTIRYDSKK